MDRVNMPDDLVEKLYANLLHYGVRIPTATKVANVYRLRGGGAAMVALYDAGYQICMLDNDETDDIQFIVVRGSGTEKFVEEQ